MKDEEGNEKGFCTGIGSTGKAWGAKGNVVPLLRGHSDKDMQDAEELIALLYLVSSGE